MAYRSIWSPTSRADLRESRDYIERSSPRYAKSVIAHVFLVAERLTTMPTASAIVPELDRPDVRQLRAYDYRIIFRVLDDEVEIVTVVHGARDISGLLRRLV